MSPSTTSPTMPASDFRTAVIEKHWNDPPETIFNKGNEVHHESSCDGDSNMVESLTTIMDRCRSTFTSGPNKRIVEDTTQRIQGMLTELENRQLPPHIIHSLSILVQALEFKDWTKALEVHTKLMTTEYEKYGSWLVGLKRVIDLYKKTCDT